MARHDPIRLNQLLGPFGPGAIYIGKGARPLVVCGLDRWYYQEVVDEQTNRQVPCEDIKEFQFPEERLSRLLGISHFRTPPDFRRPSQGQIPPKNHSLHIPCLRFPRWHIPMGKNGWVKMHYLGEMDPDEKLVIDEEDGRRVYLAPVRFIVICEDGHLDDFPWRRWLGCPVRDDGQKAGTGTHELQYLEDGSGDLDSIRVRCVQCDHTRSLRGITSTAFANPHDQHNDNEEHDSTVLTNELRKTSDRFAGCCRGKLTWHESDRRVECTKPMLGTLLSALNVYYPRTVTSILIPDTPPQEHKGFEEVFQVAFGKLEAAAMEMIYKKGNSRTPDESVQLKTFLYNLANDVSDEAARQRYLTLINADQQRERLAKRIFEGAVSEYAQGARPAVEDSIAIRYRREEYNCLLKDAIDEAELRTQAENVPGALEQYIDRVTLVERLRATHALLGFDRVGPRTDNVGTAIDWDRLFVRRPNPAWIPGVRIYGEGIFLRLREHAVTKWLHERQGFLQERLKDSYVDRFNNGRYLAPVGELAGASGRGWVARYLLVHGVAHALINQLVFECGYSSASLRERLYVSADEQAPMAAILIYTAAGDSEGTLGGLVQQGTRNRLALVFLAALRRILWCSADPVCSEVDYQGVDRTNRAACHSCILLPETACETVNRGLDRSMLIGTPDNRDGGYFSDLVNRFLEQE